MTLEELLEIVNENVNIEVYSSDTCDLIAEYDGRESIPEEYNECRVTDIFDSDNPNTICIEILLDEI